MGSFLVFNQMGFFPVAAQNVYLIGSPTFPRSTITLGERQDLLRRRGEHLPHQRLHRQRHMERQALHRSWFTHDQLMPGGELKLTMTDKPTHWDTGAPPPSMSDKQ